MSRDADDESDGADDPDDPDESNGADDADESRDAGESNEASEPNDADESDDSKDVGVPRRPYTLFVRARLSHPELPFAPALADAPGTTVRPRSAMLDADRFFVAGVGDSLDAFEAGLAADPTVADPAVVSESGDRRIYRSDLTDRGRERLAPLEAAAAFVHDASGTDEGWTVRMELPDRDALVRFVEACRAADVDVDLQRITDTGGVERHHAYGLSADQERILRTAYETGYYDVPRKVSQSDLAESFGLSTSAVSQHLRRATAELVGSALLPRRDPDP
ncbi:helix-turn-helix domain-containing protein (plasmid) [Halorussus limi]|uniref:Helix-turn-helix domain-containing protein n=1 Tax=Halorussus limi TaxID=2938695 RepID=A0A8U0I0X6_9EURY|nr:helix-turn-helix domain-containing protein [Halorussus limi]UPV76838.1 helix-turn-helix domain-containing protein [Halorussus limi]